MGFTWQFKSNCIDIRTSRTASERDRRRVERTVIRTRNHEDAINGRLGLMGNCSGKAADRNRRDGDCDESLSSATTYLSASDLDLASWDVTGTDGTGGPVDVDRIATQQAVTNAVHSMANAQVLKARDALLLAMDADAWRVLGDEAVCRILDDAAFVDRALRDVHAEDGYILRYVSSSTVHGP